MLLFGGVGQSVGGNADKVMVDDVRPCRCGGVCTKRRGDIRVLCPVKHDCGCDWK